MKKGNQLYFEFQVTDKEGNILDITSVKKVQFNIGSLTKTYEEGGTEATYDSTNKVFRVYITEQESFNFGNRLNYDVRIRFNDDTILGTYIEQMYVNDSLKSVELGGDDENA